ncbi:MAG: valine--tRNA ligase [Candidatus Sumerlaeia bacterium]|nr:valine--tRNA ligase [Candidatus Sumerlaeia bacterium]
MPKHYQPGQTEHRWSAFWAEQGYFSPDPDAPGEPYCIAIPPPNVTGALHMGHGLDETIQDTLVRYQRMRGRNALWVPGTDHAGIATQTVVANKLAREGRRRTDMGREAFVAEVWKWKEEHGNRIVEQLKRLGCSCDWSREAFTLDETRARAVRVAFKTLYDRGLIFRGEYLVNWDPVSLTALSDDEVEYEDEKGHLWHLRYPLEDGSGHVVVATTRPETMLGDTAVAVNPTDERWAHLIGKHVVLPLMDRRIPVIADDFVKKDFGTGLVKITPGHDPNDFLCGVRHGLEMINVLTEDARINENGGRYAGLDRYEARERVVADLKALGLLEKVEEHDHRIGRGYRSKAVIEPRLSKQWFVRIKPLADKALAAVESGDIRIIPEHPWGDVYRHWMTNVRDWCISRQLWWGHRIPIWYRRDDPETIVCYDGEGLPPEVAAEPDAWFQDEDVLDTWFSSALWPASILGWPEKTRDLAAWYPTNVLVTGHDILFFWVARMVMFGIELVGERPFHDVYLHGLIFGKTFYEKKGGHMEVIPPLEARKLEAAGGALPANVTARWEKMSKSKGNVIDPIDVIEEFGTDALRLTVAAYAALGRNIDLDWTRFEGYRNFVNKLWNAARFVLMVTEPLTGEQFRAGTGSCRLAAEDRWILSQLDRTVAAGTGYLDAYEFDRFVAALYGFVWGSTCDWYIEIAKRRIYAEATDPEGARAARTTLLTVLEHVCRLLHPVMPFATEEIWQIMRERLTGCAPGVEAPEWAGTATGFARGAVCVAPWPATGSFARDEAAEAEIALLQEAAGAIRNIRGEMHVPVDVKVQVAIEHADAGARAALESQGDALRALAAVGRLTVAASLPHPPFASTYVSGGMTILVELPPELVEKERQRLEKELAFSEKGLEASRRKLANEGFVAKAPADVVETERAKLARLEADVAAMRAKLEALNS